VPMVPNGRKPVPFSELYLLEPNDEVVFMFETTLEMIGKGYPHHIEFPAVMERALLPLEAVKYDPNDSLFEKRL
jgi:hypothetical protein